MTADKQKLIDLAERCEARAIRRVVSILGWPDNSGGDPDEPSALFQCAASLRALATKETNDD